MTPTPEKSHAWQMHKIMPSQRLLFSEAAYESSARVSAFSASNASDLDLAMDIMTTQRNSTSMMINSRPLTRSELIR